MLELKVYNISEGSSEYTETNATYRYSAFVNDKLIAHGETTGHNRRDGWAKLVMEISKKEMGRDMSQVTEKIILSKTKYDRLVEKAEKYDCLVGYGVDNWQGYDDAMQYYGETHREEE